ncbi:hypothetical protein BMS3Abin04_02691 [bacterium BMS3Abin04]|nr:hypothetical protein BMS3Abin04_02691 [bacterium BMS3Abin04]
MKKIFIILLFVIGSTNAKDKSLKAFFDHSLFNKLLSENVNTAGMIHYKAFMKSENFEKYLTSLTNADIKNLHKDAKLAFFINAYNAFVIKNVIDHWGILSPMDVKGFFDKIKFNLAGENLTLNEIEYERTLKIEPALSHFGLVCGAMSCPKLLPKAYSGKTVIAQLEKNGKDFLSDPYKNRLDKLNKVLYLSSIFKWFNNLFEKRYGSLVNTAKHFASDENRKFLENNKIEIKFLLYNWKLNKQ